MNDENEKFPVSLITLPIAVVVIPLLYMVLCDLLIDSGYNDLCLPTMMAAILLMAVTLMIGTKLTPQQSGTYKGITYKFNLHLKSEIVCAVISGIPTVALFILYLAVPPESRTTPITVVWLISMIAIVVAVFGFHPHSTAGVASRAVNSSTITGLDRHTLLRTFIDVGKDALVFHESERDVSVPFSDVMEFQVIPSQRDRSLHRTISFADTTDDVFRSGESMMALLNTLNVSFTINGAVAKKSVAIDDEGLKQCMKLRERIHY